MCAAHLQWGRVAPRGHAVWRRRLPARGVLAALNPTADRAQAAYALLNIATHGSAALDAVLHSGAAAGFKVLLGSADVELVDLALKFFEMLLRLAPEVRSQSPIVGYLCVRRGLMRCAAWTWRRRSTTSRFTPTRSGAAVTAAVQCRQEIRAHAAALIETYFQLEEQQRDPDDD